MGCTLSQHYQPQKGARVFKVLNVDDSGQELRSGRMEITDSELILYQRRKDPIHWPLKLLRRYGFDAELFSFECGRRCQTGAGIFAFKCRRAEALFNLLQESLHRAGQEENQNAHLHLRNNTLPLDNSNGNVQSIPMTTSTSPTLPQQQSYMNSGITGSLNGTVFNSQTASPISHHQLQHVNEITTSSQIPHTNAHQEYENSVSLADLSAVHVMVNNPAAAAGHGHRLNYAELDLDNKAVMTAVSGGKPATVDNNGMYMNFGTRALSPLSPEYLAPSVVVPPHQDVNYQNTVVKPSSNGRGMQYIQLDLHRSNDNIQNAGNFGNTTPSSPVSLASSHPESPVRKSSATSAATTVVAAGSGLSLPSGGADGQRYATIDFNKTAALSNSTKSSVVSAGESDCRKTRHNSNIEDFN